MERIDVCLDAGHGGTSVAGRSSPLGVRGQAGTLEKNVTLEIARRAAVHLGAWRVGLTRRNDENIPLVERAATSARLGARAFVSIHANAGAKGERGPETWVHPHAGARSEALASAVQRALGSAIGLDRGVKRGAMAVLDPGLHAPSAAACLVEVDFLSDREGERRLRDGASIDRFGRAIAEGVSSYLQENDAAAGQAVGRPLNVVGGDFAFRFPNAGKNEGPPRAVDGKILGVDPYEGNGPIDWVKMRDAGKWFGIAKVRQYQTDGQFVNSWPNMRAAGLVRGGYHYFTQHAAADQARLFIGDLPRLWPGDLPASLDIESDRLNRFQADIDALPTEARKAAYVAALRDGLRAWLDAVEKAHGRRPMVYLGSFFRWEFHRNRSLDGQFAPYPLWLVNMGTAAPDAPASGPWQACTFWQYAEDHTKNDDGAYITVYGVRPYTEAGVNVGGIDFNAFMGTIHELRALADLGTPAIISRPDTRVYFGDPRTVYGSAPSELYVAGRGFDPVSLVDHFSTLALLGGDPVAVDGSDCVLWRGTDNHVYLMANAGNDPPDAPLDLTALAVDVADPSEFIVDAAGDPTGYLTDEQQLIVLYADADGHVHQLWSDNAGGWVHHNVTLTAGTPQATSNPIGVADAAGHHILFRAGANGQLNEAFHSADGNWEHRVLTSDAATYEPAVYSDGVVLHVIYRGIDAQLYEATPGATRSLRTTTPCAGNVASYVVNTMRHHVYRGTDGRVYDVPDGGTGRVFDLHARTSTIGSGDAPPAAAADPTVYLDTQGVAHVVFRAIDGSLYDMARLSDNQWEGSFWRDAD